MRIPGAILRLLRLASPLRFEARCGSSGTLAGVLRREYQQLPLTIQRLELLLHLRNIRLKPVGISSR
jgi:hypothetical protein